MSIGRAARHEPRSAASENGWFAHRRSARWSHGVRGAGVAMVMAVGLGACGGVTKQALGLGETVSVLGFRAKDGSNLAFLRTITFADGHTIEIWIGDVSKAP